MRSAMVLLDMRQILGAYRFQGADCRVELLADLQNILYIPPLDGLHLSPAQSVDLIERNMARGSQRLAVFTTMSPGFRPHA